MWRYHGCHDYFSLANKKVPSWHRVHYRFHSQINHLEKKVEISNQLPNFSINIFEDEQNKKTDGNSVPMSEVDYLIEMEACSMGHLTRKGFS